MIFITVHGLVFANQLNEKLWNYSLTIWVNESFRWLWSTEVHWSLRSIALEVPAKHVLPSPCGKNLSLEVTVKLWLFCIKNNSKGVHSTNVYAFSYMKYRNVYLHIWNMHQYFNMWNIETSISINEICTYIFISEVWKILCSYMKYAPIF